jgi:SAM-dependent methyltransferase
MTEEHNTVTQLYDTIGATYQDYRRPDARIATVIARALGNAQTVVNVGAGTGSYEPRDRAVVAIEPSLTMIRQRPRGSAPAVQASALQLPFRNGAFAAALAVLTVHHWPDRPRGLTELTRVVRDRVVIVTWDPSSAGFWLTQEYFPEFVDIDRKICPTMEELRRVLGDLDVFPLPIPHDCTDGFLGAYWRRPHAYLDLGRRSAISTFSKLSDIESGLTRLRRDIEDGTWNHRYGHLLNQSELDLGYRVVVAKGGEE